MPIVLISPAAISSQYLKIFACKFLYFATPLSFELLIRKKAHLEGHKDRFLVILDSSFSSKYIGIALHVLRGDLNDDANLRHHCLCGRCDGKYSTCREARRTGIVSLDLS